MSLEILIVDDERDIRDLVSGVLEDEGYYCRTALDSVTALAELDSRRPSLVLLDVWLKGSKLDGLELLDEIKARDPNLPVIIFSGHGNIDTAVSAISRGAVDFIEKPFESEKLLHLVAKATETVRLQRENAQLKERYGISDELTGNSLAINTIRATLKKIANSGSRLLISGPAGVGKEVAARLLHSWSPRARVSFVSVSAARMTEENFERELFGYEGHGGTVTPGLLEKAHGGTLFLDEVADMPYSTQGKILRVLSDQSYSRIGSNRQIKVDVRFVSSSAKNLQEEIQKGRFREDLFYRLNVVPIEIPPLSERCEDIPALCEHYIARFARDQGITPPDISNDAMAALQSYSWPGNVRQLRNVIERTIILGPRDNFDMINIDMLPSELIQVEGGNAPAMPSLMGLPLREARENFEREYLKIQIRRFSGNISRTAEFIGMERSALHRKLKILGLNER